MGRECAYGFGDLHRAGTGRPWNDEQRRAFEELGHDERNRRVEALAAASPWVRTEARRGSDGREYVAFWVELPAALEAALRGPAPPDRLPEGVAGVLVVVPEGPLVPRDVDLVRAADDLRRAAAEAVAAGTGRPAGDDRPRGCFWLAADEPGETAASLAGMLEPRRREDAADRARGRA